MNKKYSFWVLLVGLRKNSYNKALLCAAAELLPKVAKLEIFDLEGIPLFN
jgi:NAD(P)H-dependent FMN reductase